MLIPLEVDLQCFTTVNDMLIQQWNNTTIILGISKTSPTIIFSLSVKSTNILLIA